MPEDAPGSPPTVEPSAADDGRWDGEPGRGGVHSPGRLTRLRVAARRRSSRWSWVLVPLGLFAASRAMVLLATQAVITLRLPLAVANFSGPWPAVSGGRPLVRALTTWDAAWYLSIASHGYFPTPRSGSLPAQIAFFPGWPGLLRYGSEVTHLNVIYFGVLMTFVVGAIGSCLLWRLFCTVCDRPVADRAIALWVFFPGSFVLSLVYSEGLTVTLAAACLLCLISKRWLLAGVAAGLATSVQPDALALTVCCVWAAGVALWRDRQWVAIVAPVLSVTGIAAYFGYLWHQTGMPLAWYHVEKRLWHSGNGFYFNTIGLLRSVVAHAYIQPVVSTVGLIWTIVCLVLMFKWRPPALIWVFTIALLVSALSSDPVGTRPRLLLVAFPLTLALARFARGSVFSAILASSGLALGVLTIVTLAGPIYAP